jgi:hypothetical protein
MKDIENREDIILIVKNDKLLNDSKVNFALLK